MLFRLSLLIVLLSSSQIWSQIKDSKRCIPRLDEAKHAYREGHLENVTDIKDCLESSPRIFTPNQMVDGYKLLTESYLFRNDINLATNNFENLLRYNPLYEPDTTNPDNSYDLVYLSRTYRRRPVISVYGNLGANYSRLEILQSYSTDNIGRPAEDYGSITVGLNAAIGLELPIGRNFDLVLEGNFAQRTYRYLDTMYLSSNLNNPPQEELEYATLQFREQQYWIDIPLMLRYEHFLKKNKKIIPYAFIGGAPNFLISSSLNKLQRTTSRETLGGGAVVSSTDIPISGTALHRFNKDLTTPQLSLRNGFNFTAIAGIGSKFRVGSDFITVEARYNRFILNSVNLDNRYSNNALVYQFAYVDNDYRMDNFMLTVGYVKSFYKPRKKPMYNPLRVSKKLDDILRKNSKAARTTTNTELKRELNSYIRDLERNKPGIIDDVRRGRASSKVIQDATRKADQIIKGSN